MGSYKLLYTVDIENVHIIIDTCVVGVIDCLVSLCLKTYKEISYTSKTIIICNTLSGLYII